MKKSIKIALIVIGIIIGIIVLDTIQALAFNNNPIIGTQTKCRSKAGLFVTTYHCGDGRNISKLKDSTCSTEEMCKETIIKDYYIDPKDIHDKINDYFTKLEVNLSNYAYSYVDEQNKIVIVGLIDNSEEKQNEFIDVVFADCCDYDYINLIREFHCIEFKESKEIFDAKIIEVSEEAIIVKVLNSNNSFKANDKVIVKTTTSINKNDVTYSVGNKVRITFNGNVLESNPAQIGAYSIELIN